MKKLLQLGAILCGLLMTQVTYADYNNGGYGNNYGGGYAAGQDQNGGGCPADHPCADQPCGSDCWVKYCHYEPCYYNVTRCIEEQVPCTRKCCRYVDQPYEVTKCRYVPQYYTVQCCRKVPEYYDVQECKTCKRYVCDRMCKYVPRYYWKHADQCAPTCQPQQQACCPR
jgi:hypothetical protein